MNYEKIIIELGNQIAQLSIDNAVLISRVREEQEAKEQVESKYVEVYAELSSLKHKIKLAKQKEVTINE